MAASNEDPININPLIQFISFLGILGNVVLFTIIIYSKKLKDPSYIFVTNIATSDLITSIQVLIIFTWPKSQYAYMLDVSNIICKISYSIFFASYATSMLSLTLISIYRLNIISNPFRFRYTSNVYKHSTKFAIFVWIISILFTIPLYPLVRYSVTTNSCDVYYPYGNTYNSIYFSFSLLLSYILPGFTMIICYIKIAFILRSRTYPTDYHLNHSQRSWVRSKDIFKFFVITSAIYMILSWPFMTALTVLSVANENQTNLIMKNVGLAWAISGAFIASNTLYIINPIMFLGFDGNLKSDIRTLIQRIKKT